MLQRHELCPKADSEDRFFLFNSLLQNRYRFFADDRIARAIRDEDPVIVFFGIIVIVRNPLDRDG